MIFRILCCLFTSIIFMHPLDAVYVAGLVEVHLTIEDADMHLQIGSVKFNDKKVDISKKSFMNRKISKTFKICPGEYSVEWTTEKPVKPWSSEKIVKQHQKIVVLEMTDTVVYINIRGENFTVY